MKKILLILLFFFNAYASTSPCGASVGDYIQSPSGIRGVIFGVKFVPSDVYHDYRNLDAWFFISSNQFQHMWGGVVSGENGSSCFVSYNIDSSISCDLPKAFNSEGICTLSSFTPTCTDTQYLDANNTCQEKIIPQGFPNVSQKGIPGIREDNSTSESQCIVGTMIDTGIVHAEIIGYNNQTHACIYATFFCNDGLTWNKTKKTCEVPPDSANSDNVTDTLTSDQKGACTSGLWGKSWTYDYCGQGLCYISLDVQDYNLQCGNKYIEYDCTSDYRVKTFKQVSCGDISKSDFKHKDLQVTPTNPVIPSKNDTHIDSNSTTTRIDSNTTVTDNSNIASIINSGFSNVNNSLDGLLNSSNLLNQKTAEGNNKLGAISGKLDGISNKLDDIKNAINPQTDSDNETLLNGFLGASDFISSTTDSFNNVKSQFNDTKTLIESGFTYNPPTDSCIDPQIDFHGKIIKLVICEPLSKFRPFIFFILLFTFTYLGIRIFILGLTI